MATKEIKPDVTLVLEQYREPEIGPAATGAVTFGPYPSMDFISEQDALRNQYEANEFNATGQDSLLRMNESGEIESMVKPIIEGHDPVMRKYDDGGLEMNPTMEIIMDHFVDLGMKVQEDPTVTGQFKRMVSLPGQAVETAVRNTLKFFIDNTREGIQNTFYNMGKDMEELGLVEKEGPPLGGLVGLTGTPQEFRERQFFSPEENAWWEDLGAGFAQFYTGLKGVQMIANTKKLLVPSMVADGLVFDPEDGSLLTAFQALDLDPGAMQDTIDFMDSTQHDPNMGRAIQVAEGLLIGMTLGATGMAWKNREKIQPFLRKLLSPESIGRKAADPAIKKIAEVLSEIKKKWPKNTSFQQAWNRHLGNEAGTVPGPTLRTFRIHDKEGFVTDQAMIIQDSLIQKIEPYRVNLQYGTFVKGSESVKGKFQGGWSKVTYKDYKTKADGTPSDKFVLKSFFTKDLPLPKKKAKVKKLSRTEETGTLNTIYPEVNQAMEETMGRMDPAEAKMLRENMEQHAGTPWAAATVRGLTIREFFKRTMEGRMKEALELANSGLWGKDALTNYAMGKAFVHSKAAVLEFAGNYSFIGKNRKAELDISGSFKNCNPSKDCAKFCYASIANARPVDLMKAEFTEWVAENHPAILAKRVGALYSATPQGMTGLALRINDKGDLSDAQVTLIKAMNKQGYRMQIFSKRPDMLAKVPDFNLRMLSIDSTNFELTRKHPEYQLAVTITDDMTPEMIAEVNERVAVYLPVNMRGGEVTRADVKKRFPDSFKKMTKKLCPVDGGKMKTKPGTSFVNIANKTAEPGVWTCTACDKFGAAGCFFGKNQTENAKKINNQIKQANSPVPKPTAIEQAKAKVNDIIEELAGTSDEITAFGGTYKMPVQEQDWFVKEQARLRGEYDKAVKELEDLGGTPSITLAPRTKKE